jgi:hypothetical protein
MAPSSAGRRASSARSCTSSPPAHKAAASLSPASPRHATADTPRSESSAASKAALKRRAVGRPGSLTVHVDPGLIGGERRRRGEEEQLARHQHVDAAVAGEGVVAGHLHVERRLVLVVIGNAEPAERSGAMQGCLAVDNGGAARCQAP